MQLKIIILNEASQRHTPYDTTYIWNLKYGTNKPMEQKQTHRHGEQTCGCHGGGGSGMDWDLGVIDANYYI